MAAVRRLDGQILTKNAKNDKVHVDKIQERNFLKKLKKLWDATQPRQGLVTFN